MSKHIAEQFEFAIVTDGKLNQMRDAVYAWAKSKGWYDKPRTFEEFFPTALINVHGEISELWESFRAGTLDKPCDKAAKMALAGIKPLTNLEEELADIIIRVLDTSAHLKVDIDSAVNRKHQFNHTCAHKHGGKLA